MAPMQNSQYFQPMQHRLLPDVRKYSSVNFHQSKFTAFTKPEGIDVYIRNGLIFDFNHNELKNQYLKFHFEKLLRTSDNMKMIIVGVLVSSNTTHLLAHRYTLYTPNKAVFADLKLMVYDITFPVFNADHDFTWRYDIASKTAGCQPNCEMLIGTAVKNELALQHYVQHTFEHIISADILIYREDGKFVYGESQLYWDDAETVSYYIRANQRYRGHIKRIVSTTKQEANGEKTELALYIVARFKREYINVPISTNNLVLRSYLWKHRNDLKAFPFWFTGYTYPDPVVGAIDYITVVNEFLSFIPTIDACPTHPRT